MLKNIQWSEISKLLDLPDGAGGDIYAKQALELIIGEANLKQAVDCYVNGEQGSSLARSVLIFLQSWVAMGYCHEIYVFATDQDKKRWAIELLSDISDVRALQWLPQLLEDEDQVIQKWGVKMLDRLAYSRAIGEDELSMFLKIVEASPADDIRIRVQEIQRSFQSCNSCCAELAAIRTTT